MRIIFTVLFLVSFSSVGVGGVGQVFFCESIENMEVSKKSGAERFVPIKFKFQYTGSKIKFGDEDNFFKGIEKDVKLFVDSDYFFGGSDHTKFFYKDDVFNFAFVSPEKVTVIIASCSKF